MKISEAIQKLQDILEKEGDLPLWLFVKSDFDYAEWYEMKEDDFQVEP